MSLNADDVSGPEPEDDYTEVEPPLDPTAGNLSSHRQSPYLFYLQYE